MTNFAEQIDSFTCPISYVTITHPASTPYGHTYEHEEILKWVRKEGTCPMTGQPLTEDQIIRQYHLDEAIVEMKKMKENEQNKESQIQHLDKAVEEKDQRITQLEQMLAQM